VHVRRAVAALFARPVHLGHALDALERQPMTEDVRHLVTFIRASTRGVCVAPRRGRDTVENDGDA